MTVEEFQTEAHKFADYPIPVVPYGMSELGTNVQSCNSASYIYPAMLIAEESGELVGKFAKAIRDCNGKIDGERRDAILKELGDVLWGCAEVATLLDADLSEVMLANIVKLTDRKKRGVIHGSGDNR